MRYRAIERLSKAWRVIDTKRVDTGGHNWPFGMPSTTFYDAHAAESLANLLNAAQRIANLNPVTDSNEGFRCHFCWSLAGEDGTIEHHKHCEWWELKQVMS